MYTTITRCRACGFGQPISPGGIKSAPSDDRLIPVLDLGVQPLANDFRREGEPHAGFAPLEVLFCPRCSLAQLSVVVDPSTLYKNYSYVTSPSRTMREHFESLLGDILTEIKPGGAVEIGSNDGLFLAFLHDHGFGNLIGIDPAKNLAEHAKMAGIITVNDFFGIESAKAAKEGVGQADLIIARHVFCHMNDWRGFVNALDVVASKDSLICIEVPSVDDQLASGSFDQIYHEHLSYLSLRSMKALLNESHFHVHRVVHYPVHGGAILMMLRRNDCELLQHPSVNEYLDKERVTLTRWRQFSAESELQIIQLQNKVQSLVSQGRRVCGYGASAKSTVWINACGFTKGQLYGVYDCTMEKQYCCVPGTNIPVIHEGAFYADAPDYAVVFAWNYLSEIVLKQEKWLGGGGQFIVPVPKLRTIGVDSLTVKA